MTLRELLDQVDREAERALVGHPLDLDTEIEIEGQVWAPPSGRHVQFQGFAQRLERIGARVVLKMGVLLLCLLTPAIARADMLSGCVSSLPGGQITVNVPRHHRFVTLEQYAGGCQPTDDTATATAGSYTAEFFADGAERYTINESGFNPCKITQVDLQDEDFAGVFVGDVQAFVFVPKTLGSAACLAGIYTPRLAGFPGGEPKLYTPEDPLTPVPEPSTFGLMVIGAVLAYTSRTRMEQRDARIEWMLSNADQWEGANAHDVDEAVRIALIRGMRFAGLFSPTTNNCDIKVDQLIISARRVRAARAAEVEK